MRAGCLSVTTHSLTYQHTMYVCIMSVYFIKLCASGPNPFAYSVPLSNLEFRGTKGHKLQNQKSIDYFSYIYIPRVRGDAPQVKIAFSGSSFLLSIRHTLLYMYTILHGLCNWYLYNYGLFVTIYIYIYIITL